MKYPMKYRVIIPGVRLQQNSILVKPTIKQEIARLLFIYCLFLSVFLKVRMGAHTLYGCVRACE